VRVRIDLAYDGSDFKGWARQPGLRTVEGELESALMTVLRLPAPPKLTCAGRTDAGVHARGQVVHADLDAEPSLLERRLRRIVPADVQIIAVTETTEHFDARFGALERRYVYRLTDHPAGPDPLSRSTVVGHRRPLDAELMNAAAERLVGEHDFAAFCRRRDGATTIRTLLELRSARDGEIIATTVRADAFCHSMVRSLMGCLVAVGERRHRPEFATEVLTAGRRDPRVKVMPARGLVLEEVRYPADDALADRVAQARRRRDERP